MNAFDCIRRIYPRFTIMFYSISKQFEWSILIEPDYYEQMECQYGIKFSALFDLIEFVDEVMI